MKDVEAYHHVDADQPMRELIYGFWTKKLFERTGLDWFHAKKIYGELGNSVGVYPDTCVAFAEIIRFYDIKNILELGSGFSTLFLACMAKKQGAQFRSYEEAEYYHQLTRTFLELHGYSPDLVQPWPAIKPELFQGVELLFLDSMNRESILDRGHELFPQVPIVVVDDCDASSSVHGFQFMQKLSPTGYEVQAFPFQGGGRMDRTQLMIFKEPTLLREFMYRSMGYL